MIQGILGSNGVQVHNGQGGGMYVYGDISQLGQGIPGDVRYLGNTLYVWTNECWNPISGGITNIELTQEVQTLLEWARRSMRRDQELEKLIAQYPSVKSAKEHLDVVVALTRDYNEN